MRGRHFSVSLLPVYRSFPAIEEEEGDPLAGKEVWGLVRLLLCGRGKHLDSRIWMREIKEVKVLRAHGGCLGTDGRRRAWQAAKSFG